jgi:hypothetical protein
MKQAIKEAAKEPEKRCPLCKREYSEEDNYCGDDGSVLELVARF